MTATGKKLVGRWTYDGSPTSWHTDWNGTCTAGACTRNTSAAGVSANFKLVRGTDKKEAITELRLVKGDFSVCPKRKPRGTEAGATAPTATVRQVWGQGTGSFRTKGRYASATVRGTFWLTADRCDGTFVRVRQGVIQVNDIPKRRVVTVPAPRTYLATP
jgi:hypothetical protein